VFAIRADSNGVHIHDRATGLNVLLDEVRVPRQAWALAPRYVSIALTNACELRCPFCYAPKSPARLDASDVVRWVRDLDASGCLGVGFGGGEPTAHPKFAAICREVSNSTSLAVTMTTHAHRFDEKLAESLRGYVHFVRVSVDAVGVGYERIRGRSFDQLVDRIALVSTLAPFGINMVVGAGTLDELDRVAAFAADVGATELLLLPQQSTSTSAGLTDADENRLGDWIRRYRGPVRLAVSRLGTPEGLPLADPFADDEPLSAHGHIDAFGQLRTDAYSARGVRVGASIHDAIDRLRKEGTG
jgi:MoaA/NifB/PqqE/SkfB family radical SAM enzyme